MKVKIFSTYYYPNILGGGEISTQLLAEGLHKKGIDVEVITLGKNDETYIVNEVKVKKIGVGIRGKNFENNIKNLQNKNKLLKIIMLILDFVDIKMYKKFDKEIEKCDIMHITNLHNFSGIPLLYLNKKKFKIIIQSIRAPFFSKTNIFLKKIFINIVKKIYGLYSKNVIFHFPTKYIYKYTKSEGLKIDKYFIIGNSIDIKNKLENFKEKKIDIVFVGKLRKEKGIKTLVTVIENLKLNERSIFVGDGELKTDVLEKNIRVTGWISKEEAYNYIKKAKILILPSEWEEAFGRVLIEGIANGSLIIGSDQGAIPEVLNYDRRYIFKAKSIEELEIKINRILKLQEKEYQNEVSELQKYIKKYSYEEHISEFIKFYRKAMNEI